MEVPISQLKLDFSPPCAQFFYDREMPAYEVFMRKRLKNKNPIGQVSQDKNILNKIEISYGPSLTKR